VERAWEKGGEGRGHTSKARGGERGKRRRELAPKT